MRLFTSLVLLLFFVLLGIVFVAHKSYPQLDTQLLYGGNVLLLIVTLIAYKLVSRNIDTNPNRFVRGVYGGTLLKMMILIVALMVYVMVNAATVHKPSLFVVFGMYALYAAIETVFLSRQARKL